MPSRREELIALLENAVALTSGGMALTCADYAAASKLRFSLYDLRKRGLVPGAADLKISVKGKEVWIEKRPVPLAVRLVE